MSESIEDSTIYSSAQWFMTLDSIIDATIEFMIERSFIIEHYVSQLVNYQNTYKKRHVSNRALWQGTINNQICFLAQASLENFKAIGYDRGFVLAMIDDFCRLTDGYVDCYVRAFKNTTHRVTMLGHQLDEYHRRVGLKNGRDILQLVSHVTYLHREALKLRNMILKDYEDYIEGTARRDARNHPLNASFEDLRQGYSVAAHKAIYHFNLDKGAFKSYLDIWIKKSRNSGHHYYGSAYSVPSGVKANHLYVPLDNLVDVHDPTEDTPFDLVNQRQEAHLVVALARMIDPEGYAMQALQLGDR